MLPDQPPDLSAFSESSLFSLYRAILRELKDRGVIRTENAPVGDYATVSAPGREALQVSESEEIRALGFTPDGTTLVIATSSGLTIYRREHPTQLYPGGTRRTARTCTALRLHGLTASWISRRARRTSKHT